MFLLCFIIIKLSGIRVSLLDLVLEMLSCVEGVLVHEELDGLAVGAAGACHVSLDEIFTIG